MISFKKSREENGRTVFEAREEDRMLGECEFEFIPCGMKFTRMDCGDDITAEGLARSSMNYCANRGSYISCIPEGLLSPAFRRLGFSETVLTVEIPDALASSCCGCSGKSE